MDNEANNMYIYLREIAKQNIQDYSIFKKKIDKILKIKQNKLT